MSSLLGKTEEKETFRLGQTQRTQRTQPYQQRREGTAVVAVAGGGDDDDYLPEEVGVREERSIDRGAIVDKKNRIVVKIRNPESVKPTKSAQQTLPIENRTSTPNLERNLERNQEMNQQEQAVKMETAEDIIQSLSAEKECQKKNLQMPHQEDLFIAITKHTWTPASLFKEGEEEETRRARQLASAGLRLLRTRTHL